MELQRHYNSGGVGFKVDDSGHGSFRVIVAEKTKNSAFEVLGLRVWGTWRFRLS